MSNPVPRIGRVLDALGLLFFFVGAGIYGWTWLQLRRLRQVQPASEGLEFVAVARADRLSGLSRVGLILMGVGVVVAVTAAVVAHRVSGDDAEAPGSGATDG